MTAEEIKETEKRIRKEVQKEVMTAKSSSRPGLEELTKHIYAADLNPGNQVYPDFIRMPDFDKSLSFNK